MVHFLIRYRPGFSTSASEAMVCVCRQFMGVIKSSGVNLAVSGKNGRCLEMGSVERIVKFGITENVPSHLKNQHELPPNLMPNER